eukprot:5754872-Alexandrium_andersonii.AAC.1
MCIRDSPETASTLLPGAAKGCILHHMPCNCGIQRRSGPAGGAVGASRGGPGGRSPPPGTLAIMFS